MIVQCGPEVVSLHEVRGTFREREAEEVRASAGQLIGTSFLHKC